jgi:plasmid maintenance system antidote protein VapI
MSISEFARSINASDDTIRNIIKGKTKVTPHITKKILDTYKNINRTWFETGEGEMFAWKNDRNQPPVLNENSSDYEIINNSESKPFEFLIKEYSRIITQQRLLIETLLKEKEDLQKKINSLSHN